MKNFVPVQSSNRIQQLDVFRGFAILGIFMVNILVMNCGFTFRLDWETEQIALGQGKALFFLETFFYSKFFPIFSFLFGLGVALQFRKMNSTGSFSYTFFIRRFGALLAFGIAHILFVWSGDILNLYALIGFILLLFVNRSAKFVLWLAILIFIFPYNRQIFEHIISWFQFDFAAPLNEIARPEVIELKRNGSYWSGVLLRIKEYKFAMELLYAGIGQTALSMALFGLYLVKKGVVDHLSEFVNKIQWKFLVIAGSLIIFRLILLYVIWPSFEIERGTFLSISLYTFFILGEISMALFYLFILAKLLQNKFWNTLISPLQYVGKMAFTNYILQSVVGHLMMRYFGGYEMFSPTQLILIVLAVFAFQIVLSKIWLTKFKYGPLEWLWRMISYQKILPLKK